MNLVINYYETLVSTWYQSQLLPSLAPSISAMMSVKLQRSLAEIEDIILRKIFLISFSQPPRHDLKIVFLEMTAAEILSEGKPFTHSRDSMKRAEIDRLSGNFPDADPPFSYLVACFRRSTDEICKIASMKDYFECKSSSRQFPTFQALGGHMASHRERAMEGGRICVTRAGGFFASWLVNLLLSKRYNVNGTARDPSSEKNAHLKKLLKAEENLQVFKADVLNYDTLSATIQGCEVVFHVPSPVPSANVQDPEAFLQAEVITHALSGTLNVMKACTKAGIKRVVVVSSNADVAKNPNWPIDKLMDEFSWSDKDVCKETQITWFEGPQIAY